MNIPQERRDHPWSSDEGSVNPESSDDEEPPDETGIDVVLSSQREILESALLLLQQLRERVEELEVQATDQMMSLGDTITRLRRRVRTLESGVGRSTPVVSGRGGAAHVYVTYPALDARNYVTHPALAALDFVTSTDLHIPIAPQVLPLCLDTQLADLEVAVINPGGDMDRVLARLKDLEDRQSGKSVTMGGYSFKDARAVQSWVMTLGDDEIYRFAVDFKAQLVACGNDSLTIAETI